jgi:hypothetical protein
MPLSKRSAIRTRIVAIVAALALAGLLGTAAPVVAEGPPKGIRAPDAWGAVLPAPRNPKGDAGVNSVFFDHDGRLIVYYGYTIDFKRPTYSWIGRLYDLGEQRVIAEIVSPYSTPKEVEDVKVRQWEASVAGLRTDKALELELSYVEPAKLVLEDSSLQMATLNLWPHLNYSLRKADRTGKELFHVVILYTPRDNSKRRLPRNDAEGGPSEIFVRTRALFPIVYDLGDGTYMLTGMDEPVVIRYYGNLQSPFLDQSDEVLVMDVDTFEAMTAELLAEMEAANLPDSSYQDRELFFDEFDERLTKRVRALIAAKRKKN